MTVKLAFDHYGKNDVHVSKITRQGDRNDFIELTVQTRLEGDFVDAHVKGDNSHVTATDTQRNTVYALAAQMPLDPIESYARALAEHFVNTKDPISRATIDVVERRWERIPTANGPHPTAFVRGSNEVRTTTVRYDDSGLVVSSGLDNLLVLKTAHSSFFGYPRDEYTTLPETRDRIFCTSITAAWTWLDPESTDFANDWHKMRDTMLEVFADHDSLSVQHTLYEMGRIGLETVPSIGQVKLTMPNVHHIPFDMAKLGLEKRNEIFEPTTAPAGFIEATVAREG